MESRGLINMLLTTVAPAKQQGNDVDNTTMVTGGGSGGWTGGLPASALAMFVLAGLCLLVGLLYAYLYCTRMNPRLRGAAKFGDGQQDEASQRTTTHLLLFKKS
jgi:hypothetical protein